VDFDVLTATGLGFCRVVGLVAGMPLFSAQGVPRSVPILTAIVLTVLLLPALPPTHIDGLPHLVLATGSELMLGMVMALSLRAVFSAIAMASELMSMQIGMGLAIVLDPLQKSSNGTIGVMASWLAGLSFLGMGLHRRVLEIVAVSFASVPPGSSGMPVEAAPFVVESVGICLSLGIQLAGPVLALVWMVNCFVAVLGKLAPKMNVFFSIGLVLTSVAGIALLALSLPWIVRAHGEAMAQSVKTLELIVLATAN
jgi:flagellar biosynthetic protein FliR